MDKSKSAKEQSVASITKMMICYGVIAVPVSIFSLILLILVIILASRGTGTQCNLNSTVFDALVRNVRNVHGSGDEMSMLSSEQFNDTESEGQSNAYLRWLAGSSGCGVLWSLVTLLAHWLLVEFLVRYNYLEQLKKEKKKKKEEDGKGSKKKQAASKLADNNQDNTRVTRISIDGSNQSDQDQTAKEEKETASDPSLKEAIQGIGEIVTKDWRKETLRSAAAAPDKDDVKDMMDTVGKYVLMKWRSGGLRPLTLPSLVGLFFCLLFFMVAMLSFLFGLAIASNNVCRVQTTVNAFLISGSLAIMIVPLCLSVSGILLGSVIEFITLGRIDFRQLIPNLIPAVKFKEGEKNDYWVIRSRFYFPMAKRNKHLENGYLYVFKVSWATWFLTIMMLTSIHLALSYFLDTTLVTQLTVTGCNDPRLDRRFDCFVPGTLDYISCMEGEEVELLHCYRFHRFGEEDDLVMAGSTSFAFYLATVAIFGQIFSVMKILLQIKPTRLWSFGFLTLGGLATTATITLFIIWATGYRYELDTLRTLSRMTIINQAQLLLVSLYILMIGLLLTVSKWWEKVSKDKDAVARSLFEPTEKETEQLERDIKLEVLKGENSPDEEG